MTDKEKIKELENKIEQLRRTIEGYRLLVETKDETLNIYKQLIGSMNKAIANDLI